MKLLPCKVLNNMIVQLGDDDNCVNVTLHKTVRIPEDGKTYPLPPSLGMFTVHKVDDYADKVPREWLKTGGIFFCMRQCEAMWLQFNQVGRKQKALKVGVGKVNAINGKEWRNDLTKNDSDYCVIPDQKWLDGIASGKGTIKQFVAMPLGEGYTVEHQVTGKEDNGGIQMLVYDSKRRVSPPRRRIRPIIPPYVPQPYPQPPYHPIHPIHPVPMTTYAKTCSSLRFGGGSGGGLFASQGQNTSYQHHHRPSRDMKRRKRATSGRKFSPRSESIMVCDDEGFSGGSSAREMGLAAGGTMKQKVYADRYGFESWDQSRFARVFIHIVNSEMYEQITGEKAPKSEITAQTYAQHGYPWFDLYDEHKRGVGGSKILKGVKSIRQIKDEKNVWPKENDETLEIKNVIKIGGNNDLGFVRDGSW